MALINKLEGSNINKVISKKQILRNINFECMKGEITGFVGPNGSGKSSLFKVISGLWEINSGEVKIDNFCFKKNRNKIIGNIGSLIEGPNLYEDLTAKENFEIMIKLHNIQNLDWYNYLISKFNINSFINKKVKTFSQGMKQKTAIVMALITNPNIIILDEPTNSLDITSVKRLHDILLSIKKDKIILVSSHILEEIEYLADKTYILKNGEIITSISQNSTQEYIVNLNTPIKDTVNFSSIKSLNMVNNKTIKIETANLNAFLKECIENNISIKNIKSESNIRRYFNESVGEELEKFNKN